MNRKESRPKAADKNSHAHHTAPLYRLRRRLAHWLCPECACEIDRLAVDIEWLRYELAACLAGGER
jgi:hypothetical protein